MCLHPLLFSVYRYAVSLSSYKMISWVQHLIPVSITLSPLLCYISTRKEQHLFKSCITWKHTLCFCNFPVLAVQTFYDVCSIHDSANISGKLEERTHIFPVIFPVADRIGIFLPPFFLNRFQFRKSCRFIGRIIDSLRNLWKISSDRYNSHI